MDVFNCEYCGAAYYEPMTHCNQCAGQLKASLSERKEQRTKRYVSVVVVLTILVTSVFFLVRENSYLLTEKNTPNAVESLGAMPEAQIDEYQKLAKFSNAISQVSMFRIMLREYQNIHGEYPDTLSDLTNVKGMDTGPYIDSISLQKEGTLKVDLSEKEFGKRKYFTVTPVSFMNGMNTRWECKTNLEINVPTRDLCEQL